jgi:Rps23 Pro-64 3,4-dihydroxylase Tpa1-like proline 4-hydroxylase
MNRKVSILDSGIFPILKIENFLSDTEYKEIQDETKKEVLNLNGLLDKGMVEDTRYSINGKDFARVDLDTKYMKDRTESRILTIIQNSIFNNEMFDIYNTVPETSYKLIKESTNHETELTVYKDKSAYNWHQDDIQRRVINFVLMIDHGMKFDGGHTQISNVGFDTLGERVLFDSGLDIDVAIDIEPKGNQLIMMPMWVTHRVTRVKMKSKKLIDGRITVNGHIGFVPEMTNIIEAEKFRLMAQQGVYKCI